MDERGHERDWRADERDRDVARPLRPDATDPRESEPHHSLANPAEEPDPTEYPDPYERQPDPRDPASLDTPAFPAEAGDDASAATPRPPSTSEPPPPRNYDELKPEKGE
jgi:hypothetical protein